MRFASISRKYDVSIKTEFELQSSDCDDCAVKQDTRSKSCLKVAVVDVVAADLLVHLVRFLRHAVCDVIGVTDR